MEKHMPRSLAVWAWIPQSTSTKPDMVAQHSFVEMEERQENHLETLGPANLEYTMLPWKTEARCGDPLTHTFNSSVLETEAGGFL